MEATSSPTTQSIGASQAFQGAGGALGGQGRVSWKALAAALLVVVGVGTSALAVVGPSLTGQAVPQYLTAAVARATVSHDVIASGALQTAATYDLAFGAYPVLETGAKAPAAGASSAWLVRAVKAKLGQRVTRGQVLATADNAAATAALRAAQTSLDAATARYAALLRGGDIAAQQLAVDQAQRALDRAVAAYAAAKANLRLFLEQADVAASAAHYSLAAGTATVASLRNAISAIPQVGPNLGPLAGADAASGVVVAQLQQGQAVAATLDQAIRDLTSAVAAVRAQTDAATPDVQAYGAAQASLDEAVVRAQSALDAVGVQLGAAASGTRSVAAALARPSIQYLGDPLLRAQADARSLASTLAETQQRVVTARSALGAFAGPEQVLAGAITGASLASARDQLASARAAHQTALGGRAAALQSASAAVASAQQNVDAARTTLAGGTLTAPFDGVVTSLNLVPGALAPGGVDAAIATGSAVVVASVTETDRPLLAVGQHATVTLTAISKTATGIVREIDPRGSAPGGGGVVTYPVVVALDSMPAGAASAMSAQVSVTVAQAKNVLAVPSIALLGNTGGYRVRVLDASGAAVEKPVQVGLVTTQLAEIKSGLTPGEAVVTGTVAPLQAPTAPAGGLPGLLPSGGGGNGGG